ncbi:hypothetical protein CGRA01v4_05146 [Colletotrichum graminicola]|nr:hypothetical protein CGRA01v4_05146 [Colletotrichum graminicola]
MALALAPLPPSPAFVHIGPKKDRDPQPARSVVTRGSNVKARVEPRASR